MIFNTDNTGMINMTGHPSMSMNVGKTLPEDVSKSTKYMYLSVNQLNVARSQADST